MAKVFVLRRAVTALLAVGIAMTVAWVPALAVPVQIPEGGVRIQLSSMAEGSGLDVILPQDQRELLAQAVYTGCTAAERAAIDQGGVLTVTLSVNRLSGVRTADKEVLDSILAAGAEPALAVELRLQKQLADGELISIEALDTQVEVTLVLPQELADPPSRYVTVWFRNGATTKRVTHNQAPNTVTFPIVPGEFVVVPETSLAVGLPVSAPRQEPDSAPAPIVTPSSNPAAGGVPVFYLPQSVMALPVTIQAGIPLPSTPVHSIEDSLLSVAMMMTCALVCATIDGENSPQEAETEECPEDWEALDWDMALADTLDWDEALE